MQHNLIVACIYVTGKVNGKPLVFSSCSCLWKWVCAMWWVILSFIMLPSIYMIKDPKRNPGAVVSLCLCTPSKHQFNIMVAPSWQRVEGQAVSGIFNNTGFCIKIENHKPSVKCRKAYEISHVCFTVSMSGCWNCWLIVSRQRKPAHTHWSLALPLYQFTGFHSLHKRELE